MGFNVDLPRLQCEPDSNSDDIGIIDAVPSSKNMHASFEKGPRAAEIPVHQDLGDAIVIDAKHLFSRCRDMSAVVIRSHDGKIVLNRWVCPKHETREDEKIQSYVSRYGVLSHGEVKVPAIGGSTADLNGSFVYMSWWMATRIGYDCALV